MEYHASIDASYDVIERVERKRRRLAMVVLGISIPALLGLITNFFFFMVYSHQKSVSNYDPLPMASVVFVICIVLFGLAIRKFLLFKKINKKLNEVGELEETIYNEVLNHQVD